MINFKLKYFILFVKKKIYEMVCLCMYLKLFDLLDVIFRLYIIKIIFFSFSCRDVNLFFIYVICVYYNLG